MIVVGVLCYDIFHDIVYHNTTRCGVSGRRVEYISNYKNALSLIENYGIDESLIRVSDIEYVLVQITMQKKSITLDCMIIPASYNGSLNLEEYKCDKIHVSTSINSIFSICYLLDKHFSARCEKKIVKSELEVKVELLTNQLARLDDMETKINSLCNPSSELINQTLVTKVNKLQSENDELRVENEKLKSKLQQIISLVQ